MGGGNLPGSNLRGVGWGGVIYYFVRWGKWGEHEFPSLPIDFVRIGDSRKYNAMYNGRPEEYISLLLLGCGRNLPLLSTWIGIAPRICVN